MPEVTDIALKHRHMSRHERRGTDAEGAFLQALRRLKSCRGEDVSFGSADGSEYLASSTYTTPPSLRGLAKQWTKVFSVKYELSAVTLTKATSPTSTTVSAIRELLHLRGRDEHVKSLTPERRALYEEILVLRNAIGPIDFDVAAAIRKLRDDV